MPMKDLEARGATTGALGPGYFAIRNTSQNSSRKLRYVSNP
jgi:hypothetical protein